MPKKNGRTTSRPGGGAAVAALSRSEVWDLQLARRKDTCRFNDRVTLGALAGVPDATGHLNGTGVTLLPIVYSGSAIGPGPLGTRVFDLAQCFTRYRINRLLMCYRPVVGTQTNGVTGAAFTDDPDVSNPEGIPTSLLAIESLRCSHVDSVYRDIEVEWRPVDRTAWYFCDPANTGAASGSDLRLESPVAVTFAAGYLTPSVATTLGTVELYYDITFEGATSPVINIT